jgi:hypothetical protein
LSIPESRGNQGSRQSKGIAGTVNPFELREDEKPSIATKDTVTVRSDFRNEAEMYYFCYSDTEQCIAIRIFYANEKDLIFPEP